MYYIIKNLYIRYIFHFTPHKGDLFQPLLLQKYSDHQTSQTVSHRARVSHADRNEVIDSAKEICNLKGIE